MPEKNKGDFHQAHLSEVHLKGFKSIRNTKVKLKEGLNIIIGPNGSGKSNFLDFLYFQKSYMGINERTHLDIKYFNSEGKKGILSRETSSIKFDTEDNLPYQSLTESLEISGKKSYESKHGKIKNGFPIFPNADISLVFNFVKLSFGFPDEALGLTKPIPFQIKFSKDKLSSIETPGVKLVNDNNIALPLFDTLIYSMFQSVFRFNKNWTESLTLGHSLTAPIQFQSNQNEQVISNLKKFTLIKGLKFDDGLKVEKKKTNEDSQLNIDYLRLAFLVEDEWLTWEKLSDGTKRLFYIVFMLSQNLSNTKFLIEEPELGIHPDQLFRLMDFIKEISDTNQIILTTHSPEVLNILDKNELDRIIVTKYTKQTGTIMRNLSKKEIKYAHEIMEKEGLFISDYWLHLNLEEDIKW